MLKAVTVFFPFRVVKGRYNIAYTKYLLFLVAKFVLYYVKLKLFVG